MQYRRHEPRVHGYLFEKLFAAGADDVWLTPIVMKKSRPAVALSVLCAPDAEARIAGLIVTETSTFGFRRRLIDKVALERLVQTVDTSLGSLRVKTACLDGRPLKSKPEYEDLKRIAMERGLPLREVQERVLLEIGSFTGNRRMTSGELASILDRYKEGLIGLDSALDELAGFPSKDLGCAVLDSQRQLRQGYPEVIYAEGKNRRAARSHRRRDTRPRIVPPGDARPPGALRGGTPPFSRISPTIRYRGPSRPIAARRLLRRPPT